MQNKMQVTKAYAKGRAQIEEIIRVAQALRAEYLKDHFWPACGATGGILLFFAAAVIVPP
jgi:hypothetical protein